jgi:hypothetical protein
VIGEKWPRDSIATAPNKTIGSVFAESENDQGQGGYGKGFEEPMDVFELPE